MKVTNEIIYPCQHAEELSNLHFQDITEPEIGVEVLIKRDGKVLWVDVNGACVLRICRCPSITVTDERIEKCN